MSECAPDDVFGRDVGVYDACVCGVRPLHAPPRAATNINP